MGRKRKGIKCVFGREENSGKRAKLCEERRDCWGWEVTSCMCLNSTRHRGEQAWLGARAWTNSDPQGPGYLIHWAGQLRHPDSLGRDKSRRM